MRYLDMRRVAVYGAIALGFCVLVLVLTEPESASERFVELKTIPAPADDVDLHAAMPADPAAYTSRVQARVPDLRPKADLSDVHVPENGSPRLSAEQRRLLASNGFVLNPQESTREFYEVYTSAPTPFVTSDALHHAFHLLVSDTVKCAERTILSKRLAGMLERTCQHMVALYGRVPAGLRPAAGDALTYWSVAARLTDPSARTSWAVRSAVDAELARIKQARFIGTLPGGRHKVDYTVFAPVAGYAGQPELERYFRAMRYLMLVPLRFGSAREAQACVLAAMALSGDKQAWAAHQGLARCSRFLAGEPEDPTPSEVLAAARQVLGAGLPLARLADGRRDAALQRALRALRRPTIADQPQTRPGADPLIGWGMRVLGGGVSVRAIAFQAIGARARRVSGTQVAHVLGNESVAIAPCDARCLGRAKAELARREAAFFKGLDLHSSSMAVLATLSGPWPTGYPAFMRTPAWRLKTANTQMGAWSELEHDLFLYAKDNSYYSCIGFYPEGFHGYVAPVPEFYGKLAWLVRRAALLFEEQQWFGSLRVKRLSRETLQKYSEARRYSLVPTRKHFATLGRLLLNLKVMAEKELRNERFDAADVKVLEDVGKTLKYLALNESNLDEASEPMSLIVPIARDYLDETACYVGVGRPAPIHVVVPHDGTLHLATGAVYSYYEFRHPLREPITDRDWKKLTSERLHEQTHQPWLSGKGLGL